MQCECGAEMEFIGTNWICLKCAGLQRRQEIEEERIKRSDYIEEINLGTPEEIEFDEEDE